MKKGQKSKWILSRDYFADFSHVLANFGQIA